MKTSQFKNILALNYDSRPYTAFSPKCLAKILTRSKNTVVITPSTNITKYFLMSQQYFDTLVLRALDLKKFSLDKR